MNIDEAIKQLSFHKLPIALKMRDVRTRLMILKSYTFSYRH